MPHQNQDDDDALTAVTVASDTPADFVPPPAIHHQEKQGGKFCGCCCDYRRAVIILGSVTFTIGLLDLAFLVGDVDQYQPSFDDDALNEDLIDLNGNYRILYILLEVMAIVFGAVSIMGAWTFSIVGVSTHGALPLDVWKLLTLLIQKDIICYSVWSFIIGHYNFVGFSRVGSCQ